MGGAGYLPSGGEWLGHGCKGTRGGQSPELLRALRAALESQGATSSGEGHASYLSISAFASYLEGGPEMGLLGSREQWASSQRSLGVRTQTTKQRAGVRHGPGIPYPWWRAKNHRKLWAQQAAQEQFKVSSDAAEVPPSPPSLYPGWHKMPPCPALGTPFTRPAGQMNV